MTLKERWRSQVWEKAIDIQNKALSGQMEIPTLEELIAMLSKIEWPD
jgi:hypothetical protein